MLSNSFSTTHYEGIFNGILIQFHSIWLRTAWCFVSSPVENGWTICDALWALCALAKGPIWNAWTYYAKESSETPTLIIYSQSSVMQLRRNMFIQLIHLPPLLTVHFTMRMPGHCIPLTLLYGAQTWMTVSELMTLWRSDEGLDTWLLLRKLDYRNFSIPTWMVYPFVE